jgi:hypothetical protein
MVGFIFAMGAALAVMTGSFEQGQSNPEASSIFDVKEVRYDSYADRTPESM